MTLLFGRKRNTTEVFTYKINSGGDDVVTESGEIRITFVNGAFEKAVYPFVGVYSRNGWRILKAIEQAISEIESVLTLEKEAL